MNAKIVFIIVFLAAGCGEHKTVLNRSSTLSYKQGGILIDSSPDFDPYEPSLKFVDSGSHWANTNISVSFLPDGSSSDAGQPNNNLFAYLNRIAPTSIWQREYARALQTWANVSPLNFHFVPDSGAPAGTASLVPQSDSRFGDIRIGGYVGASGIAHSAYPWNPIRTDGTYGTSGGDQFLSAGYSFAIGNSIDLYSTVLHEFGHGLGLAHSSLACVMNPGIWGIYPGLYADDVAGIQAIYGVRKPDAFDATSPNNTLSSATPLTLAAGATMVSGDITTVSDVDFYTVVSPGSFDGTLTASVDARNLSLFAPRISIYDANGTLRNTVSVDPMYGYGGVATVSLSGLSNGATYYVKASGASTGVFGMGAYKLSIKFGGATVSPTPTPSATPSPTVTPTLTPSPTPAMTPSPTFTATPKGKGRNK